MGATSSTLNFANIKLSERECRSATKELYEKTVFDAYADSDNMISLASLNTIFSKKADVFLTHDWGKELGMDNHERVARVNEALKSRGLRTWFDGEKMEGNVKKKMISGIEDAYCIVVFITKRYMDKVNGDNAEDNCQLEFNYASRRKTSRKMVPVVMETRMRNANNWIGEVGMVLGGSLYVDLATDDSFEARMDELYSRILGVTGVTVQHVMEDNIWQELIEKKAHSAALVASSEVTAASVAPAPVPTPVPALAAEGASRDLDDLETEMQAWIKDHTKIARKLIVKYVLAISDSGVGSIEKLSKKLIRNASYLQDLGIDEDDAEELLMALMGSKCTAVQAPAVVVTEQPSISDRDFADLQDYYYQSRVLGNAGKENLIRCLEDQSDEPRRMLVAGFLAQCYCKGGGGVYIKNLDTAKRYTAQCYEYLLQHAYQPFEDAVAPSDIIQHPKSFGSLAAWVVGSSHKYELCHPVDPEIGFRYVEVAALYGSNLAQISYGLMLDQGYAGKEDPAKAMQYYRLSAAQGIAPAQYNIGIAYYNGQKVTRDNSEAFKYIKLAADQGYGEALRLTGTMYEDGLGCAQDIASAKAYYQQAVHKGIADARDLLARLR